MLYSMDRLVKRLNRSVSWIRMCLGMFGIKRTRFKISKKTAYNVPKEIMQKMIKFSETRQRKNETRNRTTN